MTEPNEPLEHRMDRIEGFLGRIYATQGNTQGDQVLKRLNYIEQRLYALETPSIQPMIKQFMDQLQILIDTAEACEDR